MMFTAPVQSVGMRRYRYSAGSVAALVFGVLGTLAIFSQMLQGQPALASGTTDEKKPIKFPGLSGQDQISHFQLQPFNIPVIRGGRVERIITVSIALETKGDINKTKIMAERYHLHDAFLRDIHALASFRRSDGQTIDPRVVKTRLMVISDRILGEDIVEDILVQSIFDRSVP
jgi:hypothetical protein